MRIACSTFSFDRDFAQHKTDVLGFIRSCGQIGLDAVELNDGYLLRDRATLADIKRTAAQLALDICALAMETVVYVSDAAGARAYTDNMLRWLDTCERLGAPILRVNTAQPGNGMHQVAPGVSEEQVRAWAVEAFREVARAAKAKGILLAVENHYGLTRTSADTLAFVAAVGEDNVGVNIDTGNFWASPHGVRDALAMPGHEGALVPFEDPYAGMQRLAPSMVFSHCKVYGLTADAPNDVLLDYGRILRIFADSGYRGYLSLENFTHDDPTSVAARAAAMLRHHLEGLAVG